MLLHDSMITQRTSNDHISFQILSQYPLCYDLDTRDHHQQQLHDEAYTMADRDDPPITRDSAGHKIMAPNSSDCFSNTLLRVLALVVKWYTGQERFLRVHIEACRHHLLSRPVTLVSRRLEVSRIYA